MLVTSWINAGIFNPEDGSRDDDYTSMQYQHRLEFEGPIDRESRTTEELLELVTIPHHPDPDDPLQLFLSTPRIEPPTLDHNNPPEYNLTRTRRVTNAHEVPRTLYQNRLAAELNLLNQNFLDQWELDWARDLSNIANPLPNADFAISPMDVECACNVVTALRGEEEAKHFMTHILGIHWRSRKNGEIELYRGISPRIPWEQLASPDPVRQDPEWLSSSILKWLQWWEQPMEQNPLNWTTSLMQREHNNFITAECRRLNPALTDQQVAYEARWIVGGSAIMPTETCTRKQIRVRQSAADYGGRVGESPIGYRRWDMAYRLFCEEDSSFFRIRLNSAEYERGVSGIST